MASDFEIRRVSDGFVTSGLKRNGDRELLVPFALPDECIESANQLLRHVVAATAGRPEPSAWIRFGYWAVCFRPSVTDVLDCWEYDADRTTVVRGANLTLTYWYWQNRICSEQGAQFTPPDPEQLAAISHDAWRGIGRLTGTRVTAPSHMSGWYFWTGEVPSDVSGYQIEHLYHISHLFPRLAPLLALPPGYEFEGDEPTRIWYSDEAAKGGT